jgi:hypothetical protein
VSFPLVRQERANFPPERALYRLPSPFCGPARRDVLNASVDIAPVISELRANGITSLRAIAAALNEHRIPTPRGTGKWLAGSVSQLLARLG